MKAVSGDRNRNRNRSRQRARGRNLCLILLAVIAALLVLAALTISGIFRIPGISDLFGTPAPTSWTVTQYGDRSAAVQSMFYTIVSDTKKTIVIDGGWKDNASEVESVIRDKLGGRVDIWILTHPHPDHIGAFLELYKNSDIKINEVYAVDMNYDYYQSKAKAWDDFPVFQEFYDDAETMANLSYLKEGDVLSAIGLKMQVFNAWQDTYENETDDPANDGSLVFKLSCKNPSMLFLADLGTQRESAVFSKYGGDLKADYVQMGHHGNSSLSDSFYENIGAKGAFFDAPDFLLSGSDYTTPHYLQLMAGLGATIYTYDSAPNSVEIT